ncbi:MAG: hypothetical protein M3450_14040, partial [Actinomycetota bacterium]|nr:hypothetical protein [Actinomycetota bacterium]
MTARDLAGRGPAILPRVVFRSAVYAPSTPSHHHTTPAVGLSSALSLFCPVPGIVSIKVRPALSQRAVRHLLG